MPSGSTVDLPTAFSPETCVKKGMCPVTKLRAQGPEILESHSLYYEQHGTGTNKIVFIMGLNSSSFLWGPQVQHFGKSTNSTVLVFDNRGVGHSGYPRGPYTIAGMAEDTVCLLDHLGWTGRRELNVVGISMGGMIAQELATRIPERIVSLVLGVTTPGGPIWNNFPPWKGLVSLARLMFISEPEKKAPIVMDMIFPTAWLDSKAEGDPKGRTNREVQIDRYLYRVGITKEQQFMGHISQMAAALTHHVTPERLRSISATIPKVTIVTGDDDNLVLPYHSRDIKANMPDAEFVEWKDTGHAIHDQRAKEFNALVERTIQEGKSKLDGSRF